MASFDIFKSARLTFTLIEEHPEWDKVLLAIRNSPSFYNGDTALPVPGPKVNAAECRDFLAKHCSVAWFICLRTVHEEAPPNSSSTLGASNSDNSFDRDPNNPANLIPIGQICLNTSGPPSSHGHHGSSSVGIEILPTYQGKGYGSEALQWMQWYAFDVARLHRLEIAAASWNTGALRLYERLGWVQEGVAREAIWFLGGWHGIVNFGLLEGEWRKMAREDRVKGDLSVVMVCL